MSAVTSVVPAAHHAPDVHIADAPSDHHGDHHADDYAVAWRNNRLGLWLFFFSEIFLFGGLLAIRFYLWQENGVTVRPDLNQLVGLSVTVILLISSFSMNLAETGLEHGDRKMFMGGLVVTAVLGLVFLFGVMIFEWGLFPSLHHSDLSPSKDVFGAVIFAMTGMHALHVVSGVAFIGVVWNLGRKGNFSPERHWGVEACAIYWHYVDLVWIFFYPAIYLIGTAVHH